MQYPFLKLPSHNFLCYQRRLLVQPRSASWVGTVAPLWSLTSQVRSLLFEGRSEKKVYGIYF